MADTKIKENPFLAYGDLWKYGSEDSKQKMFKEIYDKGFSIKDMAKYAYEFQKGCPHCYLSKCDVSGKNMEIRCW